MELNKFDIFLAEVMFEDCSDSKIRPVLIIGEQTFYIDVLSITSNTSRPSDYVIKEWKEAGLKQPSAISNCQGSR